MKEMVLPEDETKIFNESLVTRLEDKNQQIKKWLTRWKPVIDHSMKRVNSFHVMAPILAPLLGVLFFRGISPSKIGLITPS
jgi:hypothetical protein